MTEQTGTTVVGTGIVGAGDGGRIVHFELVARDGARQRFLVPFERMDAILVALATAMEVATTERAKRPGYSPTHRGTFLGFKGYGVSLALSTMMPPRVALVLQTNGPQLNIMLTPEQADGMVKALAEGARAARASDAMKPS